jgi:thymidylate kinase
MYRTVAFLGQDGSGKSTVISKLVSMHKTLGYAGVVVYHLRPQFLKGQYGASVVDNPHAQAARGALFSAVKLLFFMLDYRISNFLLKLKKGCGDKLIIFDRYYYDILVDPARYRFKRPYCLARLVSRMIPKPDVLFLLDVPAEVALSRKAELSLSAAKQLEKRYSELLLKQCCELKVIDASQSIKQVMVDIIESLKNV